MGLPGEEEKQARPYNLTLQAVLTYPASLLIHPANLLSCPASLLAYIKGQSVHVTVCKPRCSAHKLSNCMLHLLSSQSEQVWIHFAPLLDPSIASTVQPMPYIEVLSLHVTCILSLLPSRHRLYAYAFTMPLCREKSDNYDVYIALRCICRTSSSDRKHRRMRRSRGRVSVARCLTW